MWFIHRELHYVQNAFDAAALPHHHHHHPLGWYNITNHHHIWVPAAIINLTMTIPRLFWPPIRFRITELAHCSLATGIALHHTTRNVANLTITYTKESRRVRVWRKGWSVIEFSRLYRKDTTVSINYFDSLLGESLAAITAWGFWGIISYKSFGGMCCGNRSSNFRDGKISNDWKSISWNMLHGIA